MSGIEMAAPSALARGAAGRAGDRGIGVWLAACAVLVLVMVVLGGVTRLTGSGLSMVAWEPLTGAWPPIGDDAWAAEFARYQAFPEFQKVNSWMTVHDFKEIFWLEYVHRLVGRLIGVVFLVPFLWFLARGRIARPLAARLAVLFVLGAMQGLLGWLMVASGLVDDPRVSPYRLTAHLSLAVAIYVWLLWLAAGLLREATPPPTPSGARRAGHVALVLVLVTIVSGGFVAGLDAGLVYNTFPKMAGQWIPDGLWSAEPAWRSAFEDAMTAQYNHRLIASATVVVVAAAGWVAARAGAQGPARWWMLAAAGLVCVQGALGVATLLHRVPVPLAALHQAGAMLVLTCLVLARAGMGPSGAGMKTRGDGAARRT